MRAGSGVLGMHLGLSPLSAAHLLSVSRPDPWQPWRLHPVTMSGWESHASQIESTGIIGTPPSIFWVVRAPQGPRWPGHYDRVRSFGPLTPATQCSVSLCVILRCCGLHCFGCVTLQPEIMLKMGPYLQQDLSR